VYERARRTAWHPEGAAGEEAFVDEEDDEELFLPLRLLYAVRPRDARDRYRERELAERVRRRKEHWEQRRGHGPRRLRGLSRDDIVGTAVAIADAEGTEAVSMRRIARDMRVGAMSLYWYVESKEELHQLMLERVQAEIEAPEPSGDWRADLTGYARNMRIALLRHPWAIDFLGIGPPSGPNDARNAERLISALDGPAADPMTTMWALMTIGTYVMGAALREIQELRWQRGAEEITADMSEAEVSGFLAEFDRRIRESRRYPHLTKILDANIDPDAPESRDERFEFGLGCLLDGIAARIGADRSG
jgi:AcrR family transcriptional regulator